VLAGLTYFASESGFWGLHQPGDNLSNSEKQERANTFAALAALPLALVPTAEVPSAIEGMHLSPSAKQALLTDLAQPPQSATGSINSQIVSQASDARPNTVTGVTTQTKAIYNPTENKLPSSPQGAPRKNIPMRLAWITLWDTDAEDGDAVRVDSQGYSRTVTLTKQPVTFAIPIPVSGNINITGIQDGEGGGITVGLASGESKTVFPIMSVGQVLGLRVKVN
jgi:hypothetical protein